MAVSAEIQIRRPKGGAAAPASRRGWTLSSLLREAARQLLPEPRPAPAAYEHPSQYTRACRGVCYSDGMYHGYRPTLFTRIFAGATLGAYLAVPYIIGLIALAATWSAWARGAAALVLATYLLPLGPVMVRRVLDAYVFLAWRRYFRFSFVFDEPLDAYKDYIIAQFPHGAFPLGTLVGGTWMATDFPEYSVFALAANNAFLIPVWRHVHTWMGTMAATEANFRQLLGLGAGAARRAAAERAGEGAGAAAPVEAVLSRPRTRAQARAAAVSDGAGRAGSSGGGGASGGGASASAASSGSGGGSGRSSRTPSAAGDCPGSSPRAGAAACRGSEGPAGRSRLGKDGQQTGVAVGVIPGGIAEMYLQHPDFERVKLLGRKGFVRVAVEHGADILPVFMFGVSQMMSFGPPWLMVIGRRLRMSVGLLYGLWGTPVPRPRRMRMAVGPPVRVGPPLARGTPEFEARVDAVHAEVVEGLRAVYYRHREAYGWGDRELLIV